MPVAVHAALTWPVLMQVSMERPGIKAVHLADALPQRWGSYIREGDMKDVQGYGTRPKQRANPRRFGQP